MAVKWYDKKHDRLRKGGSPVLPNDPVILLSYVNTKLRDRDRDLDVFCAVEDVDKDGLCTRLAEIGYAYDPARRQFV